MALAMAFSIGTAADLAGIAEEEVSDVDISLGRASENPYFATIARLKPYPHLSTTIKSLGLRVRTWCSGRIKISLADAVRQQLL